MSIVSAGTVAGTAAGVRIEAWIAHDPYASSIDWAPPQPGDDVVIPTSLHLTHGRDDFRGGLCRIIAVRESSGAVYVEVEEDPGTWHAWAYLVEHQDEWRTRYGDARGRPDPDLRPEFNEDWRTT